MKSTRLWAVLIFVLVLISVIAVSCSDGNETEHVAETGTLNTQNRVDINAYPESIVGHGYCGENAMWKLDKDGTLTIFGSGDMDDGSSSNPWSEVFIETVINEEQGWVNREPVRVKKIIIEDEITSIGENAFSFLEELAEIEIGKNVKSIGWAAFYGSDKLKEVYIPKSIEFIGVRAFSSCDELENIFVDDENEYYCDVDGVLFGKNKEILWTYPLGKSQTNYDVPKGTKYIQDSSFAFSQVLTDISFPDGLVYIGQYAFDHCSNLGSIVIPDSVTKIDDNAFLYCVNMNCAVIGKNLPVLESEVFLGCDKLETVYMFAPTVIENRAFAGCDNLKDIYYAGSVNDWNTAMSEAEYDEYGFEEPKSATKHYDYEITNNIPLESDKLPENLFLSGVERQEGIYKYTMLSIPMSELAVQSVCILSIEGYEEDSITIPERIGGFLVTYLDKEAFKGTNIKDVYLPKTISGIGTSSSNSYVRSCGLGGGFVDCWIENIYIDNKYYYSVDGVPIWLDEHVSFFYYPKAKKESSYTIPEGVERIVTAAFDEATYLKEIYVPEGVTGISYNAFNRCKSLNTVYLPKSLTYVARYAFDGCNIKDIYYAGSYADWELVDTERTERDYVHFAEPCIRFGEDYIYLEVIPQMEGEVMIVPAMDLLMALGYTYEYNEETNEITAVKDNDTLNFTVDSDVFTLNGNTVNAPVKVSLYEDVVMVPAEFLCSFLKYDAEWEENYKRLNVNAANVQTIMYAESIYQSIDGSYYSGIDDYIAKRTETADGFYELIDDFRDLEIITEGVYDIGVVVIESVLLASNLTNALTASPEETVVDFSLDGLEKIVDSIPGNVRATAPEYMTTLALESYRVHPGYLSDLKTMHEKRKNMGYFDYDTACAYVILYELEGLHMQTMSSTTEFLAEEYPKGFGESIIYSWKKFSITALPEVFENTLNEIMFEYDDSKALKYYDERRRACIDRLSSL